MPPKNKENFEEYMKKIYSSRANLPIPDHEETIAELVAEGHRLLEEEERIKKKFLPKDETKKLETKLASTSLNPYVRARVDILNKMSPEARGIIEKMEKGTLAKDSRYDTFTKAVAIRGDQLSSNN